MSHTSSFNYKLMGDNKKPETQIPYEKVPDIKELIIKVLTEDKSYWTDLGLKQFGLEKNNLLSKVCSILKDTTGPLFEISLSELELEQSILPFEQDCKVRYLLLSL